MRPDDLVALARGLFEKSRSCWRLAGQDSANRLAAGLGEHLHVILEPAPLLEPFISWRTAPMPPCKPLISQTRRDVRVVEGARLEIDSGGAQ